MSMEQMPEFHLLKRIVKAVAPDFRLISNPNLVAGSSVLDVASKVVEVSADMDTMDAIATLCFQIGHLTLLKDDRFDLFFGKGMNYWVDSEEKLIDKISELGETADLQAANWAIGIMSAFFPDQDAIIHHIIQNNIWNKDEWKKYFSN